MPHRDRDRESYETCAEQLIAWVLVELPWRECLRQGDKRVASHGLHNRFR